MIKRKNLAHSMLWVQSILWLISSLTLHTGCQACDPMDGDWSPYESVKVQKKRALIPSDDSDDSSDSEPPSKKLKSEKIKAYMGERFPNQTWNIVQLADPKQGDVRALVGTIAGASWVIHATLTPQDEEMLEACDMTADDVKLSVAVARQNDPDFQNLTPAKKKKKAVLPEQLLIANGASRGLLNSIEDAVLAPKTVKKMRQEAQRAEDEWKSLNLIKNAKNAQQIQASELSVGLTRVRSRHLFNCLQECSTDHLLGAFITKLDQLPVVTRADVHACFLETCVPFLTTLTVSSGVHYVYNRSDLKDSEGQLGKNPVYMFNGKAKSFHWHHVSQEHRSGAYIFLVTQENHKRKGLHRFNHESSQVDRQEAKLDNDEALSLISEMH